MLRTHARTHAQVPAPPDWNFNGPADGAHVRDFLKVRTAEPKPSPVAPMLLSCNVQPATVTVHPRGCGGSSVRLVAVAIAALCFAAQERAAEPITIEYRQNRATIINARLFHESDPFTFKVGPT